MCTHTGCSGLTSGPEVEKGEFDFSVTYEFEGETKTVSGVYVCEYEGSRGFLTEVGTETGSVTSENSF